MKVYVLTVSDFYEDSRIIGVYYTPESAEKAEATFYEKNFKMKGFNSPEEYKDACSSEISCQEVK